MRIVKGDFSQQARAVSGRERHFNGSAPNGFNQTRNNRKYAKSSVVASAGDAASAMYTQPTYYSPLHTPQTWQIPAKRREVYMWCRF